MKNALIVLLLLFSINALGQKQTQFDNAINYYNTIAFGDKFELESSISSNEYFKILDRKTYLASPLSGFTLKGKLGEIIHLAFNNGKLYYKNLILPFKINELENAKDLYSKLLIIFNDTKKYMLKDAGDLSNKAYGGKIGEYFNFIMNKDPNNYWNMRFSYQGDLTVEKNKIFDKYDATLVGYQVSLENINLKDTGLNMSKGITTFN